MNLTPVHPSWRAFVANALTHVDPDYLAALSQDKQWLPGPEKIFNAFSLPFEQTKTILFGESPYPRAQSANGYAFWDNAVGSLWSDTGLAKPVNRATSLRNFIKMLLIGQELLSPKDTGQEAIAAIDKHKLVQTAEQLFTNMITHGILLLNASLVLSDRPVAQDAKAWRPFISALLDEIIHKNNTITLLLMGNISKVINELPAAKQFQKINSEHPYNVSFINNTEIIQFFKPLDLLKPLPAPKKSVTIA